MSTAILQFTPPPPPNPAACVALHMQLAAVNLIMEMSDPDTFWQPFFNTLPSTDEWVCPLVTLPAEYIPLLQSEPMVGGWGWGWCLGWGAACVCV
jgi:hypothetical protein